MSGERPVCIWLCGYQGAGKTTLGESIAGALRLRGRRVSMLDGDAFRARHSPDLGFSRRDRETNIISMAEAARTHAGEGSDVVVAAMSPFRNARTKARHVLSPTADLFEVHVATPLEVCVARDTKGLYAAAGRGEISALSGVDEPFEAPGYPALAIDMTSVDPAEAAQAVLAWVLG